MDFPCLLLIVEIVDIDKMYFKRNPKTMIEKKTKNKQIVRLSHVMPFQPILHPPSHCPVILSHLALTPQLMLHCL